MGLLATLYGQSKAENFFEGFLSPAHITEKPKRKIVVENLVTEIGLEAFSFISKHLNVSENENFVTATTTSFNIDKLPENHYINIVNIKNSCEL